jgi:hypothetical protein
MQGAYDYKRKVLIAKEEGAISMLVLSFAPSSFALTVTFYRCSFVQHMTGFTRTFLEIY